MLLNLGLRSIWSLIFVVAIAQVGLKQNIELIRDLNLAKRLTEIFQCFKELESKKIKKCKDEVVSFKKEKDSR